MTITPPTLTYTGTGSRCTWAIGRSPPSGTRGPARTEGDTVLFLPEQRLAIVGDLLFNGIHPVARSGYIAGWIAALSALQAMDLETVVPGHGPIASRHELGVMRDYLLAVRDAVRPYVRGGAPLEQALAEIRLEPYAALTDAERLGWAIERAYAELAADE